MRELKRPTHGTRVYAAFLATLCAFVGPTYGEGIRGDPATRTDQELALAETTSIARSAAAGQPWLRAERGTEPQVNNGDCSNCGQSTQTASEPDQAEDASGIADSQNAQPWAPRITVVHEPPATIGYGGAAGKSMALGPQYGLRGHSTLGGTLEKPDFAAMAASPDSDHYTFGLRITF